jgi:hypothetical protein
MAGTVCIKAINQSGQHCYNTRVAFSACFLPSPIVRVLVVVLVLLVSLTYHVGQRLEPSLIVRYRQIYRTPLTAFRIFAFGLDCFSVLSVWYLVKQIT